MDYIGPQYMPYIDQAVMITWLIIHACYEQVLQDWDRIYMYMFKINKYGLIMIKKYILWS